MSALYLPPELWLRIAQSLCFHCTRDPRDTHALPDRRLAYDLHRGGTPVHALAGLCRVSRMLKELVTPVLYHAPLTGKPKLLLRSLVECPGLAAHVRELDGAMWLGWPIAKDEYPLRFMELYEEKLDLLQAKEEDIWATAENWGGNGQRGIKRLNQHVSDTVVMELLPNLTAVYLESKYGYVGIGMAPGCLAHVKSAAIRHSGSGDDVSIRRYLPLFQAAPNITSMHYYQNVPDFTIDKMDEDGSRVSAKLATITALELETCCVFRENISGLLASHPSLETFSYSDSGQWQFFGSTVRNIQDALLTYHPELRKLNIDMTLAEYEDWPASGSCGFNASLAKLQQLVYLAFDASCLGPGDEEDPFDYLVAILPASLEYLRITVVCEGPDWLRGALTSLAGVVEEKLPALKRFVIWDQAFAEEVQPPARYAELLHAWERTDVEFVTEEGDDHFMPQGCRPF
jgi:hypothetical protein